MLLTAVLVLAACGTGSGDNEVAIDATATLAPIVSLTPRATATPVPTATPIPTFTPIPSETPIPPTPSDTPTPTEPPPIIGIIASLERVNIRSGPGVNFSALDALAPGTGVEILGQNPDGRWYNIKQDDGSEGWVSAGLVRLQNTPTPAPTATPSPDLTAILLGTPLPTALLGGGTITPTPPASVRTATPVGTPAESETLTADELLFIPVIQPTNPTATEVININSINLTATALATQLGTLAPTATVAPTNTLGPPTALANTPLPSGGTAAIGDSIVPTATTGAQSGIPTVVVTSSGSAQQSGVDVLAYCDNRFFGSPAPTGLRVGATIEVFWSWFASTPQFIQQHVNNVNYEVRIDGVLLANWRQFATPVELRGDGNYWISWFVPAGPLDAGPHEITYRVSWRSQISDGYDLYGPGTNRAVETGTCNFTVSS